MTDTPTDEIAERLAELLAKATPGDWVDEYQKGCGFSQITAKGASLADNDASSPGHMVYDVNGDNDGALIAAMKNALPDLLTERAEMKVRIEMLESLVATYSQQSQARDETARLQRSDGQATGGANG
jgi:hypothetical protein